MTMFLIKEQKGGVLGRPVMKEGEGRRRRGKGGEEQKAFLPYHFTELVLKS